MKHLRYKILTYSLLFPILSIFFLTVSCEDNTKEIPAPTIYLKMPDMGYELEVGDSIQLSPKVTYDYNSRYLWYRNGVISGTTKTLKHKSIQLGKDVYSFVVNTPAGYDSVGIPVNTIILVNFNDFTLPGSFDIGLTLPAETPWFSSKGILFPVEAHSETQWTGFALSNRYNQSITSTDIYSAYAETKTKNNFLLYHQPPSPYTSAIRFNDGKDHLVGNITVCNSTLTYLVIKYGAEGIKRFGGESNNDPDWFLLTFEGYDKNGIFKGKVDFYLADYRFDNNKRNYIITKWTSVDLTSLGEVNRITLNLTSSVKNEGGGMLTPAFVCIDDVKVLN